MGVFEILFANWTFGSVMLLLIDTALVFLLSLDNISEFLELNLSLVSLALRIESVLNKINLCILEILVRPGRASSISPSKLLNSLQLFTLSLFAVIFTFLGFAFGKRVGLWFDGVGSKEIAIIDSESRLRRLIQSSGTFTIITKDVLIGKLVAFFDESLQIEFVSILLKSKVLNSVLIIH